MATNKIVFITILALILGAMTVFATEVCYSEVAAIPATCESGTITSDTNTGSCRTITCANGGNSVTALACNKPDQGIPQYLEMYRQSYSGAPLKICLGTTCISGNGYAKSSSFPICTTMPSLELSGDVKQIGTGSDKLDIREPVSRVTDTLTSSDLQALKGGVITTAEGSTDYAQYLRFNSNVASDGTTQLSNQLDDFGANYLPDNRGALSDFLVIEQSDKPLLEWQVQFSQGLKSKVGSDGRLRDIEDRTIDILGTEYNIVHATVDPAQQVTIHLMNGTIYDVLREGETKTYTLNGTDYEITLVYVNAPTDGSAPPTVKFSVNGEITPALRPGDTAKLSSGKRIGVRDILVNAREGVAAFYFDMTKLTFGPVLANTDAFQPNRIGINDQYSNQTLLNIRGDNYVGATYENGLPMKFELTSIKYRVMAESNDGSDLFIGEHQGLRAQLKDPIVLLSPTLDIVYEGLTKPSSALVRVVPDGVDQYRLQFTNQQNTLYDIPLVTNHNEVFRFGNATADLVLVEAAGPTQPNIAAGDMFVLSDARPDTDHAISNVVRYDRFDTANNLLYFTDMANDQMRIVTAWNPYSGFEQGDLVIGGHIYRIYVEQAGAHRIAIDQNADGAINGAPVSITILGGGVLSLVKAQVFDTNGISTNYTGTGLATISGHGKTIGDTNLFWRLTTLAKNFDTSSNGDEYIEWAIFPWNINGTQVIDQTITDASSPQMDNNGPLFKQFWLFDNSTDYEGMSDYGVRINEHTPKDPMIPRTVSFEYPSQQRIAQVFVVGGTTTSVVILPQNETNQTNNTDQTTCYSTVQGIPATCIGGYIIQDTFGGCRKILCANDPNPNGDATSGLQVLACDKDGFFEMYKQFQLGSIVSKVCIGDTCVSDNGFARSTNYPICVGNVTQPINRTNGTENQSNRTETRIVNLSIAPWYPKGNDYIFVCDVNRFTPTSYDWQFGDGQTLYGYNQNNVYHTYTPGNYTVRCTAKNDQQLGIGTLAIIVGGSVTPPINQTNGTNVTPPVNQTNQTNTTACYSNVKNIPVTCTGGYIKIDAFNGCRTIVCVNEDNHSAMKVLACNKPGEYNPQYFEMYKQEQTGNGVTKICVGSTCISDNGYVKSGDFPICS